MIMCTNDISLLEAMRKDCVARRTSYAKRCEEANGLFGDTQADEGGLFPDQDFRSDSWVMGMIADIDARLAALRKAKQDNTTQTTIDFL